MSTTNLDNSYLIICIFKENFASSIMRAHQTRDQLKKKFKHVYSNPNYNDLYAKNPNIFKLKTVVFIFKWEPTPFYIQKLNNPYIIWDIIDGLDQAKPIKVTDIKKGVIVTYDNSNSYRERYNLCHLINCANSEQMKMLSTKNPLNKTFDCIPHNWDDRTRKYYTQSLNNQKLKSPVFTFVGTSQQYYDKRYKNYKAFNHITKKLVKPKMIGTFNVCGSFRTHKIAIPKPGTKCAVAASMNCVFMACKNEYGAVDLLGPNYPYYFNEPITDKVIRKMIKYIKRTYKKEPWKRAMDCVREAKLKSDVITTTNCFISHFKKHFANQNS